MTEVASKIEQRRVAALKKGTPEYHQRRRDITMAAAQVFNARGFRGTTMSAVAEACGIDRGAMYYYISSKEELFDEVVREVSEANVAKAETIRDGSGNAPEKLRSVVRELMISYGTHYPLLYIYVRESPHLSDLTEDRAEWASYMRKLNRRYDDVVISIIEEGYADGTLRNIGPSKEVAFGILGMVGSTNRWFVPNKSRLSAAEVGDIFADLVLSGLDARRRRRSP